MNKKNLVRTSIIFAALAAAGVGMVVLGQASAVSSVKGALPLMGSAIFASGLTFFLVEMTRRVDA